jgi:hypothetical protein
MSSPGPVHHPDDEAVVGPSNRSFGFVFTLVFTIVALAPAWRGGAIRLWALAVAATFLAVALAAPAVLDPLNRLWMRIGVAMHRVVNPIVMGALFYLAVTPFGLALRGLRRGLGRRLHPDASASSYWTARDQPFSPMNQQF